MNQKKIMRPTFFAPKKRYKKFITKKSNALKYVRKPNISEMDSQMNQNSSIVENLSNKNP